MIQNVTYFAAETAQQTDLFTSLGIDLKMLILQGIAFIILVWALGKWVFPIMIKAVDDRQMKIEESTRAAEAAEKKAESAEARIEETLKQARKEAADIVATAKTEATTLVDTADKKARERADRIVADAHDELQKDVLAARKALEKDTLKLVKQAASLAVAQVADDKLDTAVVKKAVEGAKQ